MGHRTTSKTEVLCQSYQPYLQVICFQGVFGCVLNQKKEIKTSNCQKEKITLPGPITSVSEIVISYIQVHNNVSPLHPLPGVGILTHFPFDESDL